MMSLKASPLEQIIRTVLTIVAAISGILVGLSFHMLGPDGNAVGFFAAGIVIMIICQALLRVSRIGGGFGCLMYATWIAVIAIVAIL